MHFYSGERCTFAPALTKAVESLLPLLEDNYTLIAAWVDYNERQRITTDTKQRASQALVGLVDFWDTYEYKKAAN